MKIINDSAPGSATDVATRLMAERLGAIWGQQAVVENRPGAGGSIAVRAASQATPDGYTLYVGAASTFTALKGAPGVAPNLPIELPRDFTPIGFITQQPMFIAVSPKIGVKSLPELIALAKKKPGELSYATTGRGRITHLTMELVAGARRHQAADDPLYRRTDRGDERRRHRPGRHRDRRLFGACRRIEQRAHQGHRGFLARAARRLQGPGDRCGNAAGLLAGGWNVLLAPVGTPDAIVQKASGDLRKALDDAEIKKKLAAARRLSASDDARRGHRLRPGAAAHLAADRRKSGQRHGAAEVTHSAFKLVQVCYIEAMKRRETIKTINAQYVCTFRPEAEGGYTLRSPKPFPRS